MMLCAHDTPVCLCSVRGAATQGIHDLNNMVIIGADRDWRCRLKVVRQQVH
jgi:hypothetical protein